MNIEKLLEYYMKPIASLLKDENVTEICVNQYNDIWVEKKGKLIKTDFSWPNDNMFMTCIGQIANNLGQEINKDYNPILDARLADGTRINAVLPPIAVKGAMMSIRPFPKFQFTIQDLIDSGTISEKMKIQLQRGIESRKNILVSGGTGSGKTTLLRVCCGFIDHDERVITVEDTAENLLGNHPHCLSFEAAKRQKKTGSDFITMGKLIENSLRQRPDRIIVGEIREPIAATAFVDAINTGHSGTISTIHANSAEDALSRLGILYARTAQNFQPDLITKIIRGNIDMVVHISREIEDGVRIRKVKEILEIKD
ncbi:MAG: hypothetical protein OFPII_44050 [Osedax symbiont Rs1]|nr:MAG: hypothetical protein OFPII_44050 [Osedax symbiont Rs1]